MKEYEKATIKGDMIRLVSKLHVKYRMVHGDIKPLNMLCCSDGKLRLGFSQTLLMEILKPGRFFVHCT